MLVFCQIFIFYRGTPGLVPNNTEALRVSVSSVPDGKYCLSFSHI